MVDSFAVLADPSRRRIMDALRDGDGMPVKELVAELGLSQPNVSKHLRVLREAGLVADTVDKQRRRYRVQTDALREVDDWIAPYRRFWTDRLDDLGDYLDSLPDPERPRS